jgi:hypothetical protein
MDPFPLEKEFQVRYLKDNLHMLSREQLEDLLGQSLEIIAKLTHQIKQLMKMVEDEQG